MRRKFIGIAAISVLVAWTLRAQEAKVVADNLEFSREFYSGVHFSAIAESAPSFAYQRYPDNGPERIQCDQGTFARQHGKPWLRSEDWGESGRPVDQQMARKLNGWVKLVEAVFDFAPSEVKLVNKSREGVSVEWIFEARPGNQKGAAVRLTFARPLYEKGPNALLHGFEGSVPGTGGKTSERVKFSFGYLIAASGFELSEAAWEDLETPKELENKPVDLSKVDMGPKPGDAEGFLNRAGARGFNGDMNGAIADLSRAIELDPKSEPAVYRRGTFKLQKGDYDGAIADLSRAIELSPNTADYYSDRGLAKLRKHDNDGAIADFTRTIELDPKNAIAYRNRALAKNIKGDADGALADYNHAIELDPKSAGAFNSRGMIQKSKGNLDGALADFTKAIELNDKLAIAYKNRGEAKQAKGDTAGAREDLERAGELDPELMSKESVAGSSSNRATSASPAPSSPRTGGPNLRQAERYYESGLKKQQEGNLDGAIADYTRAIKLNPNYTEAYNNRGNLKGAKDDHDGAIADFDRAIELDPKHTISYNNRGVQKEEKHDFDGAIADFNHAIELDPKYAYSYNNRGNAKKAKGDFDGAIADFTRAIELAPQDAGFYFSRAGGKFAKRDLDGAIADLNRVIELNGKEPVPYAVRGDFYARKKQYGAAIKDVQKAIKLDPEDGDNYLSLARYQLFNRKPREAIAASLKALKLSPDKEVIIKTKLADGYLFDNQFSKAKAIYLENKDAKLRDSEQTFSQVVLGDFKELQEAGITHPDMERIKALLTTKTVRDANGSVSDTSESPSPTVKPNPKEASGYNNRGIARFQKHDFDGAIADFNRAIELAPEYAAAYTNRGDARRSKGDLDGAIADLDRAIKLDSKNAGAYYSRAYAKRLKKDAAGAIADYTRAIELDGKDGNAYKERGDVWLEKKKYHAAIDDIQKAIQLDPKNGDYYASLGWYQLFNRKPRESIAASLKALELSPDKAVMIKGNLAHGYLFSNQFEKAKAIYLENKDARLNNGQAFSQAVLDDFKELQEAGITHPDTEKIKALLTSKTEAR
jgi:tetratricopeptide (TPR) repeat protein